LNRRSRLLDETALFLHRVCPTCGRQQRMIGACHSNDDLVGKDVLSGRRRRANIFRVEQRSGAGAHANPVSYRYDGNEAITLVESRRIWRLC